MPLTPGTKLGCYEIVAPIGAGGMGEVYRATDTKLGRDVAIKVLPEDLTEDPDRLARFEREARTLASLNHRNIATLHGFEAQEQVRFLVMELVDGETLADRIERGAVPVDEALPLFVQIAEGLEAAHESGIVHRDLKPANIKIRPDGEVKILDFGLARAVVREGPVSSNSGGVTESPTLTAAATGRGEILGTAAYMSPEQAKGKPVDRRTDIWAFGSCLLETLSGARAFMGTDASEMMASILLTEPRWETLPSETPAVVRRLLRRCLKRKLRERLQHIGDARLELEEALGSSPDSSAAGDGGPRATTGRRAAAWGLGGLAAGLVITLIAVTMFRAPGEAPSPQPVSRLKIPLPEESHVVTFAWPALHISITPDGLSIVFEGGQSRTLLERRLDDFRFRAINGTEGARNPFFSPDGKYVAYFTSEGDLKKAGMEGSAPPLTLARGIPNGAWSFGSWGEDDMIVFSVWSGGLSIVSADGGPVSPLTTPEGMSDQDPEILPGSRAVLFFTQAPDMSRIKVLRLGENPADATTLLDNASHPRYLHSGHLLFVRDGGLLAVSFDPIALKITGSPRAIPIETKFDESRGNDPVPQLVVSRTGTLVYAEAQGTYTQESTLVWVERDGTVETIDTIPVGLPHLQLSPDNTQLALEYRGRPDVSISIYDMIDRSIDTLLTTKRQEFPGMPLWMPDGRQIVFSHPGAQEGEVVMMEVGEQMQERHLFRVSGSHLMPRSLSADGRQLAYTVYPLGNSGDIGVFHFGEGDEGEHRSFLNRPQNDYDPSLSPDGNWIAYAREDDVYVSRYPSGDDMRRVSIDGGDSPLWSPDGRELFYQRSIAITGHGKTEFWVRSVTTSPQLALGEAKKMFEGHYLHSDDGGHSIDLSKDGKRFLMVQVDDTFKRVSELTVVQNWFVELESLVPTD